MAGLLKTLKLRLRRGQSWLADDSGATAVEFGLLALPFFSIVAAIMQTSVIFLATQVLESAVYDASREIRTGVMQHGGANISTFRTAVCDRLFGLFPDCAGLHIRVSEITNFQTATVVVPADAACTSACTWNKPQTFSPGVGKSVVMVQVFYRYPVIIRLGPAGMSNMGDGSRMLGTATVFQNEPFT